MDMKKTTTGNIKSAINCLDIYLSDDSNKEFVEKAKKYMIESNKRHNFEIEYLRDELQKLEKLSKSLENEIRDSTQLSTQEKFMRVINDIWSWTAKIKLNETKL